MNRNIKNLGSLFEEIVSKYKNNNAILYPDGRKLTYSDLSEITQKTVSKFRSLGLVKDDKLLISGDKSPLMFASIIAALKIGIV